MYANIHTRIHIYIYIWMLIHTHTHPQPHARAILGILGFLEDNVIILQANVQTSGII